MKKMAVLTFVLLNLFALVACNGNVEPEIQISGDVVQEKSEVSNKFELDNENKYILTTNMKWLTMRNDGGSHDDVYYQIDLNTNIVKKCEDVYVGFKGYEYRGKVLNQKTLNKTEKDALEGIFESVITNIPEEEKLNLNYYELSTCSGDKINIYDENTLSTLVEILE